MQFEDAVHDTPKRTLEDAPAGDGGESDDQTVPFHLCASGVEFVVIPTAMQFLLVVQATELSCELLPGLGVSHQAEPFHRSAKERALAVPTATQSLLVVQEIPNR